MPQNKTSDGDVAGRQTKRSSHAMKDRGRGKLSRRSDGLVAVRILRGRTVIAAEGQTPRPCERTRTERGTAQWPDAAG